MRSYALAYTALIANPARNRLLVTKHAPGVAVQSLSKAIQRCAYAFLALHRSLTRGAQRREIAVTRRRHVHPLFFAGVFTNRAWDAGTKCIRPPHFYLHSVVQ